MLKNASMSEVTPQASGQGAAQALGKVSTEKDTGAHVQGFDRKYNPKRHPMVGNNYDGYRTQETRHFMCFCLGLRTFFCSNLVKAGTASHTR